MRWEALIISTILLAPSLPSLLPGWRSALVAAGCLQGLLVVGFLLAFQQLVAVREEGPAFMGLVLLYGIATGVLVCSLVARLIMQIVFSSLSDRAAATLCRVVTVSGLAIAGLALDGLAGFSLARGAGIVMVSASLWLVLATRLAHRRSPTSISWTDTA